MTDVALQLGMLDDCRVRGPVRGLQPIDVGLEQSPWTALPVCLDGAEVTFDVKAFRSASTGEEVLVLRHGAATPGAGNFPLVRVHSGCVTGDIFHSLRCDCHEQLQRALSRVAASAFGFVVYIPSHEGRGIGLFQKVRAYALQDEGFDTLDANREIGEPADGRDYRSVAAALRALGVTTLRLLTNNPAKVAALEARGISVVERIALVTAPNVHNARYLATKRDRMAHALGEGAAADLDLRTGGETR